MAYQSTNPFNAEVVANFPECDAAELESRLKTAAHCYENAWRNTSFAERSAILAKAANIMRERTDEFANLITIEMGKLIAQSRGEVQLSAADRKSVV